MIELIMSGMCENCAFADLEVASIVTTLEEKIWLISCEHMKACSRIAEKLGETKEAE